MYVRIARFEGGEGNWGERIDDIRGRMAEGMNNPQTEMPVKRSLMLVDRESGRGANVMFCESADDLRKGHGDMHSVNPPSVTGPRWSVEMYEVAVDSDEL